MTGEHRVHFFGVCSRASHHGLSLDLIGLTSVHKTSFFPLQFGSLYYLVGLDPAVGFGENGLKWTIEFVDTKHPDSKCSTSVSAEAADAAEDLPILDGRLRLQDGEPFQFKIPYIPVEDTEVNEPMRFLAIPAPRMTVLEPTTVRVSLQCEGNCLPIGAVRFVFEPPSPLSDGERRAIAGRPTATKLVELEASCSLCGEKARFFSMLFPGAEVPNEVADRATRLEAALDTWECSCGRSVIPLAYAKLGMADVFRAPADHVSQKDELGLHMLYSAGEIERIAEEYSELIHRLPPEDEVQEFLQDTNHALLWHFLSPVRVLPKPGIIGKHNPDFGILTSSRELVLVEIEKPETQLVTAAGKVSEEIQKGADQIRDWDVTIAHHRGAVLDRLGFDAKLVHNIRYLLIGGLSTRTPHGGLIKLRRETLVPNTSFMCFDELGSYLHTLSVGLSSL